MCRKRDHLVVPGIAGQGEGGAPVVVLRIRLRAPVEQGVRQIELAGRGRLVKRREPFLWCSRFFIVVTGTPRNPEPPDASL